MPRADGLLSSPSVTTLCEDICAGESRQPVGFSAVLELDDPPQLKNASRDVRILGAAEALVALGKSFFVHSDGETAPAKVRAGVRSPQLHFCTKPLVRLMQVSQ